MKIPLRRRVRLRFSMSAAELPPDQILLKEYRPQIDLQHSENGN